MARRGLTTVTRGYVLKHRRQSWTANALDQFVLTHPNAAFKKKVSKLNVRTIQRAADFLLLKRKEIKHPDPETAVSLALVQLAFTLQDMILLSSTSEDWSSLLPDDDKRLARELTRSFLNYLGVK